MLPKIGISTCLLGENVRYDGTHKLDRYLRDVLGEYVTWVPVCPEVECGLPVPREAMRLVGGKEEYRLVTVRTGVDHTARMLKWAGDRLKRLDAEDLCGFVFKTRSPSSGMRGVKIYTDTGMPSRSGAGIFAREFMRRFPLVPVEDDGRLHDAGLRENFIERVFVLGRWKEYAGTDASARGLVAFHTRHKLVFMAHSRAMLGNLGKLTAGVKGTPPRSLLEEYHSGMMEGLRLIATVKKNVNVLYHAMGYFKKLLTPDEKQELREVIERYHRELVPLVVPVTLLNHFTRKYDQPYLKGQYYLNPHPAELKLRNHV